MCPNCGGRIIGSAFTTATAYVRCVNGHVLPRDVAKTADDE